MVDPITVGGTAVAVISLGIQVTQELVNFYNSYKNQKSDLVHITNRLNSFLEIFQSLKKTLAEREFPADEQELVKNIQTSIENCREVIDKLDKKVKKFKKTSPKGRLATIKIFGRQVVYPFRQSTLQKLDKDIKSILANISPALNILNLRNNLRLQDTLSDLKGQQVSLNLHSWLNAPDASVDHKIACAKTHPGTGMWLIRSDRFSNWLTEGNSIMWLNGFAGSGKSVLCSTAIVSILDHRRSDPNIGIAFFYFTFNDKSKQDESAMLRALLLQLSNQDQNNNENLTEVHNSYKSGVPPASVLIDCLRRLIQRFSRVYIVLDALDESPRNASRERVLDALKTMRSWGSQCLHLLVTSRDEPDIRESLDLPPAYQVEMRNSEIDKDISNYISSRLDTDPSLKGLLQYRGKIQESLATGAKGMFRWVDCQLQTLRSCRSDHHLDSMLSSLPESLDETYERMLCNIDSYWIGDARRMLTMLCFASRPLTVQELIESVNVETGESAGLNRKRRLWDLNVIREICGGLVDIVPVLDVIWEDGYSNVEEEDASEDGDVSEDREVSVETVHKDFRTYDPSHLRTVSTVQVAHFSVQEYLESKRISGQKAARFGLSSIAAPAEIAEICLIYLLEPGLSRSKLNQAILEDYPLAPFAARYWYYHYRKTKTSTEILDAYILRLFQSQTSFATWVRLHNVDRSDGPYFLYEDAYGWRRKAWRRKAVPAPIYYASLLGLDKVLRELLHLEKAKSTTMSAASLKHTPNTSEQTFSATGKSGGAMQAAAYHGNHQIIQILLEGGFDINDQGNNNASCSALYVASHEGHAKLVQMLLDRGADVNAQDDRNSSALQMALDSGHKEIVQILLDRGADVNAQGGQYKRALTTASEHGDKEMVHRLLDRGADVNGLDNGRISALQGASRSGYKEIVQILVDRGADVNAEDDQNDSALTVTTCKEIMQILLDRGANIDAQGRQFGSALQSESLGRRKSTLQLLLDRGADVNARGGMYGTALEWAAKRGRKQTVQMLLDGGARVSIGFNRALTEAVYNDHADVVQILLNGMNAEDFDNEWQMASSKGDPSDEKIIGLLKTHDFPFRHKPSVTKEA